MSVSRMRHRSNHYIFTSPTFSFETSRYCGLRFSSVIEKSFLSWKKAIGVLIKLVLFVSSQQVLALDKFPHATFFSYKEACTHVDSGLPVYRNIAIENHPVLITTFAEAQALCREITETLYAGWGGDHWVTTKYKVRSYDVCNGTTCFDEYRESWLKPNNDYVASYSVVEAECRPAALEARKIWDGTNCVGPVPTQDKKNICSTCPILGNPVNPGTGNKYQVEKDYIGAGSFPLVFRRSYNSLLSTDGNMSWYWRSSYTQAIQILTVNASAMAQRADGKEYLFLKQTDGTWQSDPDVIERLEELTDGLGNNTGWQYITVDDVIETYDTDGKLISITRRDGLSQTLDYDLAAMDGGDDNPDTLDVVTDPAGRTLAFSYDASFDPIKPRVTTLTDPAGQVYSYGYGATGNLISVTYPDETPADNTDNPQRLYHYENLNLPSALTGITDENGNRFATWTYDDQNRAISSEHAGGAERVDIVYNADGTTTATDSLGNIQTYHFEVHHNTIKVSQIDGGPCSSCGNQFQNITYDANGFVASRTDFNGNLTTFINNSRGLQASRTEAVGTPIERTITTEWHPDFRLPTQITEPGRITTFTYDTQGRLLERKVVAP